MIFDLIGMISEWFYPAFFVLAVLAMIFYNITDSIRDRNISNKNK